MGGSSKKQTVGYKIYVDQQLVLCAGPIDGISRLTWDGKEAWSGWCPGGRINVDKPKLFGGEKREGGVSGAIDFCPGGPAQAPSDYLVSKLGALVNAARAAATLVLRGLYVGMNPYLKRPAARAHRIHVRGADGDAQWYDTKAAVGSVVVRAPFPSPVGWEPFNDTDNGAVDYFSLGSSVEYGNPDVQGWLNGYLGPWRATKAPRYTSQTYAVPAGRFDLSSDPFASHVVMQINMDGTPGTTPALDDLGNTVTNVGSPVLSMDHPLFGGPMLKLVNDAASYISDIHQSLQVHVGVTQAELGDAFTIDGWAYLPTLANPDNSNLGNPLFSYGPPHHAGCDTDLAVTWYGLLRATILPDQQFGNTGNDLDVSGDLEVFPPAQPVFVSWTYDGANHWLHINGKLTTGYSQDTDMNPAHIIREAWTDPRMSMGVPDVDVDDDALMAAADLFHAEGFGLSPFWSEEQPVGEFIDDICRHVDAEWYVDRRTGKLTLYPIRNDYDPDTLLVLDRTNSDPVENLTQPLPGELVNSITVQFWNEEAVKDGTVTLNNDALVQAMSGVNGKTVKYGAITNRTLAARVAARELRTLGAPLRSCMVSANRQASGLNKGHPFVLNRPEVGLNNAVMRVTDIDCGDGRDNRVRIKCVEDVFQMPSAPIVSVVESAAESPVQAPIPSPARLVSEAPYLELVRRAGQRQTDDELAAFPEAAYLMVAAQRPSGDALSAGLAVNAGGGYEETATIDFSPVATLAGGIGRLDAPLTISGGVDLEDVVIGSLAQVGDELLRVDALDAVAGTMTVGRGCLDTVPVTHLAGEHIWFLDLAADGDEVQHAAGDVLAVKVLPETGEGQLDLAAAPADSVTMAGRAIRPYPPANVRLNGSLFPASVVGPVTVTWVTRNRVQQTSGTLLDWLDGGVMPEAGQTTVVELYSGATLLESWPGETDGTVTLATDSTGTYTLKVYSQRDGYDSWTAVEHIFDLLGSDALLTEDGADLLTEDGALLIAG